MTLPQPPPLPPIPGQMLLSLSDSVRVQDLTKKGRLCHLEDCTDDVCVAAVASRAATHGAVAAVAV